VIEVSFHHLDLTREEKAEAAAFMKNHMKETQRFLMPPMEKIVHNNS